MKGTFITGSAGRGAATGSGGGNAGKWRLFHFCTIYDYHE